jgi:dTMP kinase
MPRARRFAAALFVSSLGDWIGLIAILSLSFRLAEGTAFQIYGPGMVLLTRTVPGFLFGQVAGPLVDRWDRRKVLAICDVLRGLLVAMLPFVPNLALLILNQLLFEIVTMLWQPAKEASIPNVVPKDKISQMNSLSQVAAYGTFPLGALAFSGLAELAQLIGSLPALQIFRINQESLALFLDTATFFFSAYLLGTLDLPSSPRKRRPLDLLAALRETREGYREIARNHRVRTVIAGMSAAIFGAGAVISLGPLHVRENLRGGASGFGVLVTALGIGAAVGVLSLETIARRIPRESVYPYALVMAGAALLLGSAVTTVTAAAAFMCLVGLAAAPAYIAGVTVVHHETEDYYRGRSFAALLSLTRLAMMVALGASPIVAGTLGSIVNVLASGNRVFLGGTGIELSGSRLALVAGGLVILASGVVTAVVFHGSRGMELEAPSKPAPGVAEGADAEGLRLEGRRPRISVAELDPLRVSIDESSLLQEGDADDSGYVKEKGTDNGVFRRHRGNRGVR